MSSPQLENGYTRIANEILENLVKTALLGAEFQVCLFVLRKTYGFNKKKDRISLTQFQKGTGLSRPTIIKALKNLMARNMVVKVALPDEGIEYSFIKDHENWVVKTAKLVKHNDIGSKDRFTKIGKDGFTHKRKKEITKDIPEQSSGDTVKVIDLFKEINPSYKRWYGNTTQRGAIERLLQSMTLESVSRAIAILPQTNTMPYAPTITTPQQLEDKIASLRAFVMKEKGKLNFNNNPKWKVWT